MDVSTTPVVQYTYSSPGNGSRLASMVYPNGRAINYNYSGANTNGALDDAIGRLDSISDSANSGDAGQVLEQYSYLGLSTIIARNHPQTGINLALVGAAGSIGSGGDQYIGLDQFGRVVNQNWVNSATGASVDNYTYTYDQNSNVTAKNNVLNSTYSETYSYDLLNRLTAATRGGAAYQSWNLDSQGNWSSSTTNGTTQTQTANAQNQITSISGAAGTPTYDANGNMTTDQNGNTYTYNAWNQLVAVKNSTGQIIAQYTYNAMGYRITEAYPQGGTGIPAGEVNYIYYNSNWQAIETRTDGTAAGDVTSQMVWSAAYINAAVLQDTYSAGALQTNSRIYFLQDANWDTTAIVGLVGGNWQVVQRYVYSSYGTITVLNADWSTTPTGTQPSVSNLYQGMTLDSVTGLYDERFRNYSPELGTWISQDPAGYINGANIYQYVESSPVGNVDAEGKFTAGPIHYIGGHRFYRNYRYERFIGQWNLPGSPDAGLLAEAAKDIGGLAELGRAVNLFMESYSGSHANWAYDVYIRWGVTRVFTYKCIEGGHPTDVEAQSTTRKNLHIYFLPHPQHWGGTSGNLVIGADTAKELRADFSDIAKEIYQAYRGS